MRAGVLAGGGTFFNAALLGYLSQTSRREQTPCRLTWGRPPTVLSFCSSSCGRPADSYGVRIDAKLVGKVGDHVIPGGRNSVLVEAAAATKAEG